MKYILILAVLIFVSCSGIDEDKNEKDGVNEETRISKDTLPTDEEIVIPGDTVPYFTIQFRVVYSLSYCGGAYPQDEVLQELHKERSYGSSKIKMVNNDTNEEFFFTTDRNGRISDSLHRGNYQVFLTPEFDSSLQGLFNPKCKLILDVPIYTFRLKVNYADKIHKRFECDPCDPNSRTRP